MRTVADLVEELEDLQADLRVTVRETEDKTEFDRGLLAQTRLMIVELGRLIRKYGEEG